MRQASRDAAAILALPHAHHPRLRNFIAKLSASPLLSFAEAYELAEAARMDAGITVLDIEMVQPGAHVATGFMPTTIATPGGEFKDRVSAHVQHMLGSRA